jgi:hypothetical protein
MMIVGTITSQEEASEVELIVKNHVVGNRAKLLAEKSKKGMCKKQ